MFEQIRAQAAAAAEELCEKAGLRPGSILAVGCSTSEVGGSRIGTDSNYELATAVFGGIYDVLQKRGVYLAAQCCEHLNRAIVIERAAVPGADICNAVPQPKAGGSFATCAYRTFADPVVIEAVRADAGMDVGRTLIGMHVRPVVVPCRLEHDKIGAAIVIAARSRPKFIGGDRAVYDEKLK